MRIVNHQIVNLSNVNVFPRSNSAKRRPGVAVKGTFHTDERVNGLVSSKRTMKDLGESSSHLLRNQNT